MQTVLEQRGLPDTRGRWAPWLAVAAGLLLLYVPTYIDLSRGLWRDDAYAHGPIILGVFAWLVWRGREVLLDETSPRAPFWGAALFVVGLLLYVIGRSQALTLFEVASHLPVIAGIVLMLRGPRALRRLAFPILFLFFLIPLPGFILDAVTTPLKEIVSAMVEVILRAAGYPIERSGVVLEMGQHQMLVADACSGLNSLYSLFALGLLYAHLTGPSSRARIAILVASIVPIAIAANVLRVMALVLITYHFGEEAAQGLLHGFAGMLVFVVALAMLLGVDKLIRRPREDGGPAKASRSGLDSRLRGNDAPRLHGGDKNWAAYVAAIAMLGAALAAPAMKPVRAEGMAVDLEKVVPTAFGDWRIDTGIEPVVPAPDVQSKLDRIYRQIVTRTYVNPQGEQMMLTIAYGGDQSDALKAHRQEACYRAQGFEIESLAHGELAAAGRTIPVTRMLAVRGERFEPVTYWFTMGDRVVLGRAERLKVQLASGLAGRIPDGMLVRVSSLSADTAAAFNAQRSFIAAIFTAMPSADATRFVGAARS
jgi:exosortase B